MNCSETEYISWGGGVNSTAIIARYLLESIEPKPEIVFADTGAELAETYEYIDRVTSLLQERGWTVTVIDSVTHPDLYASKAKGKTLYEHLWDTQTLPSIRWRYCTAEYKTRPLRKYAAGRVALVGMCADEPHRAKLNDKKFSYPVLHYTRVQCQELIIAAGLPKAHKTGCYFCSLQPKRQWIELYKEHRNLWDAAVKLEQNSILWNFLNGKNIDEKMDIWMQEEKLISRQLDLPGVGII